MFLLSACGSGTVAVGAPIAALDEDGGFGIYGDKTRYATLQKKRETTTASASDANNTPASIVASARGYETMRNLRTSIPSLVTALFSIISCVKPAKLLARYHIQLETVLFALLLLLGKKIFSI